MNNQKTFNPENKQFNFTKESVEKLTDEELNKVAGGLHLEDTTSQSVICPPGCYYIQNGCDCGDD